MQRWSYELLWFYQDPRVDYVSLLERAHRDDRDFIEFIAEREFESQKEMLRLFQIPFPREGQE